MCMHACKHAYINARIVHANTCQCSAISQSAQLDRQGIQYNKLVAIAIDGALNAPPTKKFTLIKRARRISAQRQAPCMSIVARLAAQESGRDSAYARTHRRRCRVRLANEVRSTAALSYHMPDSPGRPT